MTVSSWRSTSGKSQGIMSPHPDQTARWPCDRDSHFPSLDTGFCRSSCPPNSTVCQRGAPVEPGRQCNQCHWSFLSSPNDKKENIAPLPGPRRILESQTDAHLLSFRHGLSREVTDISSFLPWQRRKSGSIHQRTEAQKGQDLHPRPVPQEVFKNRFNFKSTGPGTTTSKSCALSTLKQACSYSPTAGSGMIRLWNPSLPASFLLQKQPSVNTINQRSQNGLLFNFLWDHYQYENKIHKATPGNTARCPQTC